MKESPPNKLVFLSDNSEADLVVKQPAGTHKLDPGTYLYRYSKALENLGKEFPMAMKQIQKLEEVKLLLTK